jgi:outer membrane protein assembly factor BamB
MKTKLLLSVAALTTLMFTSTNNLEAQKKSLWEISPKEGISWMRNTSLGNVIISTSSGLQGIDPVSGKTNWTIAELAFAPEESFEEIKNTPFIAVSPKDDKDQLYIIEPFEGKILFSSKESNISKIASKYFLYQCNSIIIVGYEGKGKEPIMACVDMVTGKKLWSKSSDFSKVSACIAVSENEMILSTLFYAYKINSKTGDEIWKQAIDPSFANPKYSKFISMLDKGGANSKSEIVAILVKTDFANDIIFMGAQQETKVENKGADGKTTNSIKYESFYNAFKISTGDFAWKKPVTVGQKLGIIIPCKEGLVICARDRADEGGKFGAMSMDMNTKPRADANLLDYNTGELKWGKKGNGIDVKAGPVLSGALVDGKMLLTSGDDDNYISLIDPVTGINKFPKFKVKGQTQRIVVLPKGILIATDQEVDYINKTNGESYLEKAFKSNASLLEVTDKEVYIFNKKDGLLYKFGKNETAAKAFTSKEIEFEGKEDPTKIEVVKEGVLISSDQNLCLIDMKGKTVYQKYYPAPRESNFKRALLYASAARAAYATVALGYTSAVFGATSASIQVQNTDSQIAKDVTKDVSQIYGNAAKSALNATSNFMEAANKRFTATSQSADFVYILSEVAKKEYHLIKVSKTNGQTLDEVNLGKDKEPKYELDDIENVIYYEKGGKIIAYKF